MCIPSELYDRFLSDLHEADQGIEKKCSTKQGQQFIGQGIDANITEYVK